MQPLSELLGREIKLALRLPLSTAERVERDDLAILEQATNTVVETL